jgi:DNA-binding NarL/FixJ family response regulator
VSVTEAEARRSNGKRRGGTATLIGPDATGDPVAEVLHTWGLKTTMFECVEDIPDGGEHPDPSVVVLLAEDTSPSLARTVGALRERFENIPFVVVCADMRRWGVRAALTAGVAGVVLYEDIGAALGPCLQAVQSGQICVPRGHWQQVDPPSLSAREKQILGLVVMGYMNSQIAEQLFLAESTVKSHLSSAFGKLGVRSRNEAVDLILDPDRGLGMGILSLGGEPVEAVAVSAT